MLKVSIIIPTKNNGDILEKCLASIKQTLGKFDQQPFRKSLTNKLFFRKVKSKMQAALASQYKFERIK